MSLSFVAIVSFIVLGLLAGFASGLIGIGGGLIIVPVLVFGFGFTQHLAQGTTLALMVPPIGIAAAWTYYQKGDVDIRVAVLICVGFVLGSLFGARVATSISNELLGRIFGGAMLVIALKMIWGR
ncbi:MULTISPECIES: sulfite exporter TauE/SafE family protein [unclassified Synechocystis]|uniref:sulfite exporter TauE/SafE family protein n=1 Tax=unclassified Synechocystis TaxID=2640012 RepID=UPI00048D22B0|nr:MULTISPECIES: sulfite exporter TauE/SafE family protein [unclassified Synechocystis]MCT0255062.1 sulfite exporter TauE/SafE family protein [Synechocystis sp. CS-94]